MLDRLELDPTLLDADRSFPEAPSDFAACLNAHGTYSTIHFVLRLSPRVHQLIDAIPSRIAAGEEIDGETIQAYSTYLHETVHWWQHIGSTAGLVLSLAYPAQAHQNSERLEQFAQHVGPKKSIMRWAEMAALAGETIDNPGLRAANIVVNNAIDIEFYKIIAFNKDRAALKQAMHHQYFESVGHCYWMAYGHALALLSATVDRGQLHLPDGQQWDELFRQVRAAKVEGWVHGEPVRMPPLGLRALFEGQARMIQLQFLTFGVANPPSCEELRDDGYFDERYGEAFKLFLKTTGAAWPKTIDDPVVALFLLIVDLAINPTAGFPLDIESFENFILDVDPGVRFLRFCLAVANRPELLSSIKNYSRSEYMSVAASLTEACGYDHPGTALSLVKTWATNAKGIAQILKEKETFRFEAANLVVRVLFSYFVSFCIDKLERPEFFCWTGAWMAGERVSETSQGLFLKYLALFTDRADDNGIFPRRIPGVEPEALTRTLSTFYGNVVQYDLIRQWIVMDGPFRYDFEWLSQNHSKEDMANWAGPVFEKAYGVRLTDFEMV
ncbi:hypothetical protein J2R96_005842 [Bradyrhizobium elkanii]|nr:hypothetical protein [Bradyrhizobium elkanii]